MRWDKKGDGEEDKESQWVEANSSWGQVYDAN